MDESLQLQMWEVIKSVIGIVVLEHQAIIATQGRLNELTVALQKQFDWMPQEPPPAPDPEMLERMTLGLAELERMFRTGDEKKEGDR